MLTAAVRTCVRAGTRTRTRFATDCGQLAQQRGVCGGLPADGGRQQPADEAAGPQRHAGRVCGGRAAQRDELQDAGGGGHSALPGPAHRAVLPERGRQHQHDCAAGQLGHHRVDARGPRQPQGRRQHHAGAPVWTHQVRACAHHAVCGTRGGSDAARACAQRAVSRHARCADDARLCRCTAPLAAGRRASARASC
jgi:hypothetical protein